MPLTGLLRHVRSLVNEVRPALADLLAADRRALRRALVRIVASVEFHGRARGLDTVWVHNLVPGLGEVLEAVRVPRDADDATAPR